MSGSATGRRRLDASVPPEYEQQVRPPRLESRRSAASIGAIVALAALAGTIGSVLSIVAIDVPSAVYRPSAALLTIALTTALVHRAGGHMRIWVSLIALLSVAAAVTELAGLIAAAAATTGVVGAVLAVVFTLPSEGVLPTLREYVISVAIALSGAAGVAAWNAQVNVVTFSVTVVGVSLLVVLGLVWALGEGLHGLGRNHLAILAAVAVVLLLLVVYTYAVRSYGSTSVINTIDSAIYWMRTTIGGVPRPVQAFAGFPALVVGLRLRSQRREGWWILVFAVLATSSVTTALVSPLAYPTYIGLSILYSAVIGFVVGWLVSLFVLAPSTKRAARRVESTRRVEPSRWEGLR
ncbi:hypothetical protein [Aeromicrobium alkaliterrae]|uniref:Uncharacterized protein n=1 Tax=Aeromicrobium alkaliterrae TaxID=302168 RepID=A0ABP4VEK9_9ACTN